jgi:hypothetical protein
MPDDAKPDAVTPPDKAKETPDPEPEIVIEEEEPTPAPLEPGGVRFNQVYAEKKQAEERVAQLAADKARLEAQLAATTQKPAEPQERTYTDDELDALEDQARIRGDRMAVRQITNYRIQTQAKLMMDAERKQTAQVTTSQAVGKNLFQDFTDLTDPTSDLYKAAATEYNEVVKEYAQMGRDATKDPYATELAVSRAVRKSPELAKKLVGPKKEVRSEGAVVSEDRSAPKPPTTVKLSKRELDFCRKSGQDPKEYAKWRRERRAE